MELTKPQALIGVASSLGTNFAYSRLMVLRYKDAKSYHVCNWDLWPDHEFTDG